jgi:hypothetical protein
MSPAFYQRPDRALKYPELGQHFAGIASDHGGERGANQENAASAPLSLGDDDAGRYKPDGGIYQQDKEPCMGMFDTVTFRYRMPDGETESEYRPKTWTVNVPFTRSPLVVCSAGRMTQMNLMRPGLTAASPYAPVSAITCALTRGSWNGSKDIPGETAGRLSR